MTLAIYAIENFVGAPSRCARRDGELTHEVRGSLSRIEAAAERMSILILVAAMSEGF